MTPSSVTSLPLNFGSASGGSLKASQWRALCNIYLPIALITLWGDNNASGPPNRLDLLDHSMYLFLAVIIACCETMDPGRIATYRKFLKVYVDGLRTYYPHTIRHKKVSIIHIAFHIYDFLHLFGPVMSWWCFSLERLIGFLQKLNTSCHVGGMAFFQVIQVVVLNTLSRGTRGNDGKIVRSRC